MSQARTLLPPSPCSRSTSRHRIPRRVLAGMTMLARVLLPWEWQAEMTPAIASASHLIDKCRAPTARTHQIIDRFGQSLVATAYLIDRVEQCPPANSALGTTVVWTCGILGAGLARMPSFGR